MIKETSVARAMYTRLRHDVGFLHNHLMEEWGGKGALPLAGLDSVIPI